VRLLFYVAVTALLPPLLAQQPESDLDRYSDSARQALAARKWSDAVQALEHLARLAPDVPEVHANLGLAYFFEGRPANALESFERAQKLNPGLAQVQLMIGLTEAELGRCSEAMSVLAAGFDDRSDRDMNKLSGLHLLRCYSELKQPDKALSTGETLLARYPADPEVLYQVSRLHAERSSDLMSTLLRTAPDSAWTHYANAQVQESLNHLDNAAREYRLVLERDPGMAGVHYKLGRVILNESRAPEALERARHEFELELKTAPNNADAEYELGELDREQGRAQAAVGHFARAIQLHPDFLEARVGMAKTLLGLGQAAEALPHLQVAARLDPNDKVPHYLLASAYKTLGDSGQAAKEFEVYRKLGTDAPSAASQNPGAGHN
jgi:tetratricopeptide (TPR) repeat protein